jgi:hypothetical protein
MHTHTQYVYTLTYQTTSIYTPINRLWKMARVRPPERVRGERPGVVPPPGSCTDAGSWPCFPYNRAFVAAVSEMEK